MDITVNGKNFQVSENLSLEQLLVQLNIPFAGSAVAVGSSVVPQVEWSKFSLTEGAKVTIIRATQGG